MASETADGVRGAPRFWHAIIKWHFHSVKCRRHLMLNVAAKRDIIDEIFVVRVMRCSRQANDAHYRR